MKIPVARRMPDLWLYLLLILTLSVSCKKLPEPDFSYSPEDNPEAGDTIFFTNNSLHATSYEWEFGDGKKSIEESPAHVYEQAGIFDVTLKASNEAGDLVKNRSITINEPTVLAFFVYDSVKSSVLKDAEVWLYDNEFDHQEFNEPLLSEITDFNGLAVFYNLEPVRYYIWIIKMEADGFWGAGGATDLLVQNEDNVYEVMCYWYPNPAKSTSGTFDRMKNFGTALPVNPAGRIIRK